MIMFAPHPFLNLRTTTPWIMKLLAANFCENLSNHDAQISSKSSNPLSYHSEPSLIRIVDGEGRRGSGRPAGSGPAAPASTASSATGAPRELRFEKAVRG